MWILLLAIINPSGFAVISGLRKRLLHAVGILVKKSSQAPRGNVMLHAFVFCDSSMKILRKNSSE
jgi:hypothetical protein